MPFDGTTPTEIIDHILHEVPPPPSRYMTGVPPALDAVVARALEKDPAFRYQSAREMAARPAPGRRQDLDGAPLGRIEPDDHCRPPPAPSRTRSR